MRKNFFLMGILLVCIISNFGYGQTSITLITPYDKDTIETVYPMFSWHYMDLPEPRSDIEYSFMLVKLKEEQSASAGLIVNTPLVHINGISGFHFSYPFDAPELKYNNRYGWKIQKKVNGVVVSESESWEFILYKEIKIPQKYALLNMSYSSTVYEVDDKGFFFKLNNRYRGKTPLNFVVLNEKSERMPVRLGDDEKLVEDFTTEGTGRDFYFLVTDGYPVGTYTLKTRDVKGNEYNTRFKVK